MNNTEQLLRARKLRVTPARKALLQLLAASTHAITHAQIEEKLGTDYDRVTIYRTLHTFENEHLVHKILSDTGGWAYAICRSCEEEEHAHPHPAHKHQHHHHHAHFKCERCALTFCLEDTAIPPIPMPAGYSAKDWQLLVTGICEQCNTNA